ARLLGLGYPGGPAIQAVAAQARGTEEPFTRPRLKGSRDFSYSGLKTAVLHRARKRGVIDGDPESRTSERESIVREIAAAFQEAVVDSLVDRTIAAADEFGARGIIVCGGVAANAALRKEMTSRASLPVLMPRPSLCTDNGAMIAAAAFYSTEGDRQHAAKLQEWDMDVIPGLAVGASRVRNV
ncbi:MAG: tRNA (adenosine(37)-N6)-threonylcarbamoyltransferase complex transferase subunit TsaD, partial [Dehalococcoidia bacterium]|nr:tRNA (adenosine(37)-N6)-threonylcarbamoyltransferase complex transferase subunit TsaD [Dehalococcoidia bacterium]